MLICTLMVNKKLPYALWHCIKPGQFKKLVLRCSLAIALNIMEFTIVKYISLVFQGIARNLTPIVTCILAYFMVKERFTRMDAFFIFVSLIGIIVLNIGQE